MQSINRMIDHTILKANATKEEVLQVIEEAKIYQFYSVCIQPCWVALAKEQLAAEPVAVCTVIGFPLGANTSKTKEFEAQNAIENGADELDMVINVGFLKSGEKRKVQQDIETVCRVAKGRALVKVIIETALLTKKEIIEACQLSMNAGADFVKTSTGFSTAGAKKEDIALMSQTVEAKLGVKASGGIHNLSEARAMIEAGATRIGTSSGVAIMQEMKD